VVVSSITGKLLLFSDMVRLILVMSHLPFGLRVLLHVPFDVFAWHDEAFAADPFKYRLLLQSTQMLRVSTYFGSGIWVLTFCKLPETYYTWIFIIIACFILSIFLRRSLATSCFIRWWFVISHFA